MIIRNAITEDYEKLMKLYNLFVGSDRYSKHNNDAFLRVLKNPNNFLFVAEENGLLIGFASFSIRDVIRYPKKIAELDELFVLENFRKSGVGKQLIIKAEEKARKLDCYRMFIESHYDHKTAHQFYEALGYTNYGYHFIKNL